MLAAVALTTRLTCKRLVYYQGVELRKALRIWSIANASNKVLRCIVCLNPGILYVFMQYFEHLMVFRKIFNNLIALNNLIFRWWNCFNFRT